MWYQKSLNEFVTRVLQQNVQLRTEQAGQTLEFFQQEVERLGTELDSQSARLLEFQNKAGIAVPSNLGFLQGQQTESREPDHQPPAADPGSFLTRSSG